MSSPFSFFSPSPMDRSIILWRGMLIFWADGDRYNTFYVLYPIGISSECTLAVKALAGAQELHPLYYWFIVAVLVIYVPGMLALVLVSGTFFLLIGPV